MSETERREASETEAVAVTEHGAVTIPERFRDQLGINTPGRVLFRETDDGTVTVERVPSPSEMRGFAVSEATTETPATELLREKRKQDRAERENDQLS